MTTSAYSLATSMLGSHEHRNHSALTSYLKNGGVNLDPAQQAWCAAFVNASLQQSGQKGTGSNMARSFQNWGVGTNNPREGDIAVFSRGNPNGPQGHVGFFKGRDANGNVRILAGNQGDAVTEATLPANRLLGFRTAAPSPFPDAPPPGTPYSVGAPGAAGVGYVDPSGAPSTLPGPGPTGLSLASNPITGTAAPAAPAASTAPQTWQEALGQSVGNKDAMSGLDDIAKGLKNKPSPEAAAAAATINPTSTGTSQELAQKAGLSQSLMSDIMQRIAMNSQRSPMGVSLNTRRLY